MDANPEYSEQDILDSYLCSLSSATIDGACINQTATGCSLSTDMRSDICNSYYCDSLKHYQNKLLDKPEPGIVLLIQRAGSNWKRFEYRDYREIVKVALLNEETLQPLDISLEK